MCFLLIHMPGSKWRPHRKIHIYYSNVSGKRLKILEKLGKTRGILSGTKCRNHDQGMNRSRRRARNKSRLRWISSVSWVTIVQYYWIFHSVWNWVFNEVNIYIDLHIHAEIKSLSGNTEGRRGDKPISQKLQAIQKGHTYVPLLNHWECKKKKVCLERR